MATTSRLGLPFIEASQAQKHVTHNEALRILDAAIQLTVIDRTQTLPPANPSEGDRHIVAAGASGGWLSSDNAIATWEDGAWRLQPPQIGWIAWSIADDVLLVWDGSEWRDLRELPVSLDNIAALGVNAGFDSANRLRVHSNAALFDAVTAAEGGSGDMRMQIVKESSAGTASIVFSNNFSGRVEFGITGSDALALKVSPDGSSWRQAMTFEPASALASFGSALALTATLNPPPLPSDQDDYAPSGLENTAAINLSATSNINITGLAGGIDGRLLILVNAGAQTIVLKSQSSVSSAQNRIAADGDVVLGPDAATLLRYDGSVSRWRCLARPAAQPGASAEIARRQLLLVMSAARSAGTAQFLGSAFADSFATTTYVDVAGATNLDTSVGCLRCTSPAASYILVEQGAGSIIGNMTSGVGLSSLFDGNSSQTTAASAWHEPQSEAGTGGKNWGSGNLRIVGKVEVIGTTDYGFAGGTVSVEFKIEGSNDGTSWTTLLSTTFANAVSASIKTFTEIEGLDVSTAYQYHRVSIRDTSGAYYGKAAEIRFFDYLTGVPNDLTVSSRATTLPVVPAALTPAIRIKHVSAATAGTDYNIQVSRDGGATWSPNAVLTDWFTDPTDGTHVVFAEPVDVSGQPSGSDVRLKVTTSNNKKLEIHDWGFIASSG